MVAEARDLLRLQACVPPTPAAIAAFFGPSAPCKRHQAEVFPMTEWFTWWHFFSRGSQIEASPWLPPAMDDTDEEDGGRSVSPLAAPVHVQSGSALVRIDNGVLVVERDGEPRFERPMELVAAVHIHGPATITSPCVAPLIAQGTPVARDRSRCDHRCSQHRAWTCTHQLGRRSLGVSSRSESGAMLITPLGRLLQTAAGGVAVRAAQC
jgi:hypothetical protein